MTSRTRFGFAALGFAVAGAVGAIVVAVQLYVRGLEADEAGGIGFSTSAESILLIGGAVVAVIGTIVGLLAVRRSASPARPGS